MKTDFRVIGLMSGTSMDGVDIAFCEYRYKGNWTYQLIEGETIPYSDDWRRKLSGMMTATAKELVQADMEYGKYLGNLIKTFCEKRKLVPDAVSSHGHTIFHQPSAGYTFQLGAGAAIAAVSGFKVVWDFRRTDVAKGGQGAPLVPIGDRLLFAEYDLCLNLGGIANISLEAEAKRVAGDICGCNILLNYLASKKGLSYDRDGEIASKGECNTGLLEKLSKHTFFIKSFPKSLGREDLENTIEIIDNYDLSIEDKMSTVCEHIAMQIAKHTASGKKMLLTGGGALNIFLVERIRAHSQAEVSIPEKKIIEFKEAIIFGLLGVLRLREEVNCLSSVTGAMEDSCGGSVVG